MIVAQGLRKKREIPDIKKVKISRSRFVEKNFHTDDGRPMSFSERPYWPPIYNINARKIVLLTSRQSEKSTFLAKDILTDSVTIDGDSALYISASQKQVQDFSNKKLRVSFFYNKDLANFYLKGKHVVNNVFDKMFSNGSKVTLRHAGETGDAIRGNTARKICIDERQSINNAAIPVALECAATFPDTSRYIYAGTPLSSENGLSYDWYNSFQYEWMIKCHHCNKYNEPLGEKHIDEKIEFLFCQYCKKEMNPWNGVWVPQNPNGKYPGFRIVRLMVPFARWRTPADDGILDKLRNYPYYRFLNEVLAIITDSGFKPVVEADLRACCDPAYRMVTNPNPAYMTNVYAGLDWAMEYKDGSTSFTKLGIFQYTANRFKLLYAKTYDTMQSNDPEYVIKDVVSLCNKYNVAFIGADYGVGHKENVRIKSIMPNKLFEFQYTSQADPNPVWDSVSMKYTMNRTISLDEVFNRIKHRWYHFPVWEDFAPFAKDILAENAEFDHSFRKLRYDHNPNTPDDFLHCLNYATWAFFLANGK
jgi:hypothetical protein